MGDCLKIKGGVRKDNTGHPPLASTCIDMGMYTHTVTPSMHGHVTHTHTHTHTPKVGLLFYYHVLMILNRVTDKLHLTNREMSSLASWHSIAITVLEVRGGPRTSFYS